MFFSDRMQAPSGRLIHLSNLQKWGAKLVMPGLAAGAQAIVLLAKGFTPQA